MVHVRYELRNRCARKDQSLLFDLYKVFDSIRTRAWSHFGFFSLKRPAFLHACATCSELPYNISAMQ